MKLMGVPRVTSVKMDPSEPWISLRRSSPPLVVHDSSQCPMPPLDELQDQQRVVFALGLSLWTRCAPHAITSTTLSSLPKK